MSKSHVASFTIDFAAAGLVSDDELGRWMEAHGASVQFSCMLGTYAVTVTWRKRHSYSDTDGSHYEEWVITRHGRSLPKALEAAIRAAIERAK